MAIVKSVRGFTPQFGKNCFLAENAVVVGEVVMGDECTIWFNAVVRGDVHSITIGNRSNIQDGAVIHCTYQKAKTIIGNNVSIAHSAVVHGCTIEDNVLIVMDDAIIGSGSVIAAGAIVLPGTKVEPGSVFAGIPAKRIKEVGEEMKIMIERTAKNYPMYAEWYKEENQK
jgi:gamma-carbonic anhydrase